MAWAAYGGQSQVLTTSQDGSDARLLAQEGEVTALSWGSALPGGDSALTVSLHTPHRHRTPALNPGRLVTAFRGGPVWHGTLTEPAPNSAGGWDATAQGQGTYGNNWRAVYSSVDANNQVSVNNILDDAIGGRGQPNATGGSLRWRRARNLDVTPGLDRQAAFEKGSRSITEALNGFAESGALTWWIERYSAEVQIIPLPKVTAPSRLLVTADPAGRTLSGYYNACFLRYQATEDATGQPAAYGLTWVGLPGQWARHGRLEGYADYSNAGVMPGQAAGDRATGLLDAYQAIAYTGEFTVIPGQVLTLGGTPVDLGCEEAGEVYKVIGSDMGYGGEHDPADLVSFLAGGYVWDDVAQAAKITPYTYVAQDFASLTAAMAPPPAMPKTMT